MPRDSVGPCFPSSLPLLERVLIAAVDDATLCQKIRQLDPFQVDDFYAERVAYALARRALLES
jgi:hypothetical protein